MPTTRAPGAAIAVVGASALFPGAIDGQSFWRNILAGHDAITDVPPDNWLIEDYFDPDPSKPGKIYVRRGAFIPKIDFDPLAHGVPPNQLSSTDTAQLLALITAQKVLDDAASVQFGKVSRQDISVILGVASATELVGQMAARIQRPYWQKVLRELGLPESQVQEACDRIEACYPEWNESTFPGLLGNVVAGRIANRLDLGGANCVVDAACASSLGAVAMAMQELELGHSDLVITGGVDTLNDSFMFMCFSKTPALSPTGDCRPFSDNADGTMLGEGIGMLALRRLADAERDGDRIYAVLQGLGSSSDGRAKSIYAPRSEGQEIAIRRAHARAGHDPGEVGLVEAHGTATKAGDLAEFEGLRRAFAAVERQQSIALGSVKSQIGHTKAAAGAASLFKTVMALHHKVLPPTIKVERPSRKLAIETSPFYLNTEARPWIQRPGAIRKAGVSSFGFGGSNFHLALEEYAGSAAKPLRTASSPVQLILLGAPDAAGLAAAAREAGATLDHRPLAALAWASQLGFIRARHRLAVLAADVDTARATLVAAAEQVTRDPGRPFGYPNRMHYGVGEEVPKTAFLFPGQGSQYVNMGRELALEIDAARAVWDVAAALDLGGAPALHEVTMPIPVFTAEDRARQAELLTRTEWAQPSIGAASLAILAVLRQAGLRADATAGHSYGEVMALHAAGVIPEPLDMLAISRRRGELMAAASAMGGAGAMLALRVSEAEAQALIAAHGAADVTIANINSPQQVVVAGPRASVDAFRDALQGAGIASSLLPVATAFHTRLVSSSAEPFTTFLAAQRFAPSLMPVYGNTLAEPYAADPAATAEILGRQLAATVRFAAMIERMYADGVRLFIEVGPGTALTGMVGDCLAGRAHVAVGTDHRKVDGRAALFNALGAISAAGADVDFAALWAPFAPVEAEADAAPLSPASVKLGGANYGKPYLAGGAAARPGPNPERPRIVDRPILPAEEPVTPREPAVASPPLPDAPPPPAQPEAWAAFQAVHENLLQAQKTFTETLAASHAQFLRASEASLAHVAGLMPAAISSAVPAIPAMPAAEALRPPSAQSSHATGHLVEAPQPAPLSEPTVAVTSGTMEVLLEVVAQKTGYPVEMLSLDMELEAGLGIDSIKRVQILSALQERLPELAAVDSHVLTTLNTLGEIVAFAERAAPAAMTSPQAPKAPSMPPRDVVDLLLATVSEKTGYPVEMLSLDMELEAGLGIDSIKRVQILSALQERLPQLAAIDGHELAAFSTLGDIAAFAGQVAPTASAPPRAPEAPTTSRRDVVGLLLATVSEKTGYPVEMLSLDMELEAGLGIDSIKRVQILSALQEKLPELAAIDSQELAALNTLGEIVAFAERDAGRTTPTTLARRPLARGAALETLAVSLVETPSPGAMTPGLIGEATLWIAGGPAEVRTALARRLNDAGVVAEPVELAPADASALVLLSGLEQAQDAAAQLALNARAFAQLQLCAGSMAERGRLLVTVQATGGDFGFGDAGVAAWSSGIAALAKTAALEWPHVQVKAIDVAPADATSLAEVLAEELLSGGAQLEVGVGPSGRRVSLAAGPASAAGEDPSALDWMETSRGPAAARPLPEDGVVLVSGGARGVTAACLAALLGRRRIRLAILGRTPLRDEPPGLAGAETDAALKRALLADASARGRTPTPQELAAEVRDILAAREVRANLARLRAGGAELRYVSVDVTDADAVRAAVGELRATFGPIRALVHAAGVLADRTIQRKTMDQFQQVMQTKAGGFLTLLEATRGDDLTRILCFSSVAAWRGNPGQCDYAMANTVLNRVCHAEQLRRGAGCRVLAIGWGPWAGGMVDAGLEAHFAARGVGLIPLEEGAAYFADAFLAPSGPVELLVGTGLAAFGGAGSGQAEAAALEAQPDRREGASAAAMASAAYP